MTMLNRRMFPNVPTLCNEFSIISFVSKWSGAETSRPLEGFLFSIERAFKIRYWDEANRLHVATLRLADTAIAFYVTQVQSLAQKTRHGKISRTRSRTIQNVRVISSFEALHNTTRSYTGY